MEKTQSFFVWISQLYVDIFFEMKESNGDRHELFTRNFCEHTITYQQ